MSPESIDVLVVEGDSAVAERTATELEAAHGEVAVEVATSAAAAVEAVTGSAPDCVVSAYELPDADGIELLEAVREDHPDLPFVLFPEAGSESVASDAISAGVTDYVQRDPDDEEQYAILANHIDNLVAQHRSRRELEAYRRRLSLFVEQSPLGVIEWDTDFELVRMNETAEDILGYDEADLEGESWESIVPEDEREDVDEVVEELLAAEGGFHSVNDNVTKSGERITCEWHNRVVTDGDGDVVAVFSQFRDVTDRIERERELELRDRVIEAAPVGITIADATREDEPLVYANDRFCELTGYDAEELLGRNCRVLQGEATDPEPVARMREAIEEEEPVSVELRNYRKDGTEFWNRVSIAPVRDEAGTVTHYAGFQQDVTDRRERERQLAVLDRVLRHNVHNDMAFIRGVAEDIRDAAPEPIARDAERLIDGSDRLLATIDKQRAVTKALLDQSGRHVVDVVGVLDRVVGELTEGPRAASVTLAAPDHATVEGLRTLPEALRELLDNAVRHSDSEVPSVDLRVTREADTVTVRVADDGPPIPEAERGILDGDHDIGPLYHGSGLGLWLVYWVVTRSGGTVEVRSNDPRGNVVVVTLPRASGDRAQESSDEARTSGGGNGQ